MTPEEAAAKIQELEGTITGLRNENAGYRVKNRELEGAVQKLTGERTSLEEQLAEVRTSSEKAVADAKGEVEKINRSNGQKFANLRTRLVDEALRSRLSDVIDPEVLNLIDRKTIEVDEETFELKNVDDVVKAFREAKPAFFKPVEDPTQRRNAPPPPRGQGNGNGAVDWGSLKSDEIDKTLETALGVRL